MFRVLAVFLFTLAACGCQAPAERQALKPLPEPPLAYPFADMLSRARLQAGAANEAFYLNKWTELEEAAKALEQTSRFLVSSTEVPEKVKETLPEKAGDLGKEAGKLLENAKTKDVSLTNQSLQRINLKVRELRPEN